MGNGENGKDLNSIEIIDLESSSTTCQDLTSFPRAFFGGIGGLTPHKNPIICGGYGSRDCSSYENGIWTLTPAMKSVRYFAAASASPYPNETHTLFVTGGRNYLGNDNNISEVLNDAGWQELPTSLPVVISDHCMALLNSTTVLIIGGVQNGSKYSQNTFYFNTEYEKWIEGPKLMFGRKKPSCGNLQIDEKGSYYGVIVAGGSNSNEGTLSSVELLELGSSEWVAGPELPEKILGSSMVEYSDGGVFYIGGYSEGRVLDTIFYLAHGKSEWVEMPQKLKIGTAWATSFLVPDEITNCS